MRTIADSELLISYSQIAVYRSGLQHPYSDWTEEHIQQGFAWRDGSVSFSTLDDIRSRVEVSTGTERPPLTGCIRAIAVPFQTDESGVGVSSILSQHISALLPAGMYELIFMAYEPKAGAEGTLTGHYRIHFVPCASPKAEILLQDNGLEPPSPLQMNAEAAM
ncbi:competence protein ComJ [Paenibacillus pasadenensis]|uniref:competence protein ComJ n=1 Tax=Paenibacillus pasadenensis TaxID=217090 RepID=UPI00203E8ACF|nr:competence protein ComJ [Paenibacillus pasadenensis]MCM3747251.1 competence protein ComJ [Paenibacillus pasadenensis]